jgi:putative heme-binding domain-containing protein
LTGLANLNFQSLPLSQQLGLLRALSLTLERLGKPSDAARAQWISNLESVLPNPDTSINLEAMKLLVYLDAPSVVTKGMRLIVDRSPPKAPSWEGVEEMNARYGTALKRLQSKPTPAVEINYAFALRTAKKGWTPDLRRKYFEFLNDAGKAGGGASYPGYLENTRDEALAACTDEERSALADLTGKSFNPVPDFPITPPIGPGREWTLDEALSATTNKKAGGASFERGRNLFHAAQCGACHRFQGLGGGVGPDLTSVPNKFDMRYLIEATINPSKDISDQYQSSNVLMEDGRTLSGLVIEQDEKTLLVYPSDPKAERIVVLRDEVDKLTPSKVSQMPAGLLNSLNGDEIKDLTVYIMSGGNSKHKSFEKQGKK